MIDGGWILKEKTPSQVNDDSEHSDSDTNRMEEPDEEAQVDNKSKTKFMKKPQGLQISLSDDDSDERDDDKGSEEPTDKKEMQIPVVPPVMDKTEQDENASKDKD